MSEETKQGEQYAVATRKPSVIARMAERFGVDQGKMLECLKATAFKGGASNEQLMALCIVAEQYKLNPWTKEIFAFPDKQNGIVPVVGVDGWSRIINEHQQFDGMEFVQDAESCTCTIYRKDRAHPISATEYMDECKRNTSPWGTHPRRMLRHKALIQAARLAFGYTGIYDQDEAERIIAAQDVHVGPARPPQTAKRGASPLAGVVVPAEAEKAQDGAETAAESATAGADADAGIDPDVEAIL
jgi:phage recombination protein Bet